MIQFKRGKTASWLTQITPLADGQPGYDRERNKLKIGNGKDSWSELPDASGMHMDEILSSEEDAKKRVEKNTLASAIGGIFSRILNIKDRTIITYGTEAPNEETVGQIYLQDYDAEPEVDYVVESANNNGWYYQKWRSGNAMCTGTFEFNTKISQEIEGTKIFHNDTNMTGFDYPFTFTNVNSNPIMEIATVQSPKGLVWLAGLAENTKNRTGIYRLLCTDKQTDNAKYKITFYVVGRWK